MHVIKLIREAAKLFAEQGIETNFLDAKILMKHINNWTDEELLRNYDKECLREQLYRDLALRRAAFEPIAYIIGYKEFYGREFEVSNKVLIPRPDSETIIESVRRFYGISNSPMSILDIGTGSGCLLITLLSEFPSAQGIGLDISKDALMVAQKNVRQHALQDRARLIESDLFQNLKETFFDVIVCNPPYISVNEKTWMNKDTNFEPKEALFANDEGLAIYTKIAEKLSLFMKSDSRAFFEIGLGQENRVVKIFQKNNLFIDEVVKDLASTARCIVIRK
jgi:release factor glutamine methyltransferase